MHATKDPNVIRDNYIYIFIYFFVYFVSYIKPHRTKEKKILQKKLTC